jgi:hypothetical protein
MVVGAVVTLGAGANIWYARCASENVTRHIREIASQQEKALDRHPIVTNQC